ncbi:MAG: hypothetical protein QME79_14785 [Bacillota bacterium]|nr:hypothetical protein [Bacillota bacterium]
MSDAISIHRRNDRVLVISVQDESGAPLNLGAATLAFVVKSPSQVVITKSTSSGGIIVTDALNGKCEITLTSIDTDLAPGDYNYELLVTDLAGRRYTALEGLLVVQPSLHA